MIFKKFDTCVLIIQIGFIIARAQPDSVYVLQNGAVVVEAGALQYSSEYWRLSASPAGYTGSGYLQNIKSSSGTGEHENVAESPEVLGTTESWLKIDIYVEDVNGPLGYGGIFAISPRTYRNVDGDGGNDMWVGIEGIMRIGSLGDAWGYRVGRSDTGYDHCWGALNPERKDGDASWARFVLQESERVYTFFISPRTVEQNRWLGVDRIVIAFIGRTSATFHQLSAMEWPDWAWETDAPVSTRVPLSGAVGTRTISNSAGSFRVQPRFSSVARTNGMTMISGLSTGDKLMVSTIQGRLLHSATPSVDTYTFRMQHRGNGVVTINGAGASLVMRSRYYCRQKRSCRYQ